jgi:DNA replication protein DnaC
MVYVNDNTVAPCACRRASTPDPVAAAGIPPNYQAFTLATFPRVDTAAVDILGQVREYCFEFARGGRVRGDGLLFYGPPQSHKTRLAVGVLLELIASEGVSGAFWRFPGLVREMGRAYDKSSLMTRMETLDSTLHADVLLLDDLGSRRMPDWAHNTLFEIIDHRYRSKLPTIVTAPFDDVAPADIAAGPSLRKEEYLVDRVGLRVRSRLREMCLFIPTSGLAGPSGSPRRSLPSSLSGLRRHLSEDR